MTAYTIQQIRNDLGACEGTSSIGWHTVLEASGKPKKHKWTLLETLDAGVILPEVTWYCHRTGHPAGINFPIACSILALPIFEADNPKNYLVRNLIKSVEQYLSGEATYEELREARLLVNPLINNWSAKLTAAVWSARAAGATEQVVRTGSGKAAAWAAECALSAGVPEPTLRNHLRTMLVDDTYLPPKMEA